MSTTPSFVQFQLSHPSFNFPNKKSPNLVLSLAFRGFPAFSSFFQFVLYILSSYTLTKNRSPAYAGLRFDLLRSSILLCGPGRCFYTQLRLKSDRRFCCQPLLLTVTGGKQMRIEPHIEEFFSRNNNVAVL